MKVGELLRLLADLPDDAEINYSEPNFGGRGDEFYAGNVTIENGEALIDCPYWEDCEG